LAYKVSTTEIGAIIDRISSILNGLESFPSENKKYQNKRLFDDMSTDDYFDEDDHNNYDNYGNHTYFDDDEDDFNDYTNNSPDPKRRKY
jgi:hypothetical protein